MFNVELFKRSLFQILVNLGYPSDIVVSIRRCGYQRMLFIVKYRSMKADLVLVEYFDNHWDFKVLDENLPVNTIVDLFKSCLIKINVNSDDIHLLKLAFEAASKSVARRLKVGATLLLKDRTIIRSFNSMHPNYSPECDYEHKGKLISYKEVFHAELHAIGQAAKIGKSTMNARLYVTDSPCINCALAIVASGIKTVIYCRDYRDTSGIDLLKKCGVEVIQVPIDAIEP